MVERTNYATAADRARRIISDLSREERTCELRDLGNRLQTLVKRMHAPRQGNRI